MRLRAGDARRHDLAVLLDEILQHVDVLVIDLLDAFGGEPAELLALEQIISALPALAVLAFTFAFGKFGASSHRSGHVSFLPSVRMHSRAAPRLYRYGSGGRESRDSAAAHPPRRPPDPWRADRSRSRRARTPRAAPRSLQSASTRAPAQNRVPGCPPA